MTRIAIFVGTKGRGTNMAAIIAGCASGDIPAEVAVVISPVEGNPASLRAQAAGVTTRAIPKGDDYGQRIQTVLDEFQVDLICLAGYMFLLPEEIVHRYQNRILNIHPALLPKFGGKGMYGMHVHEAVIAAGEVESGCTVHYVTEQYDEGAVIHQKRCPVLPGDTPDMLADRVLDLEQIAYAEALKMLIDQSG